jgi:hypothetical protein
MTFAAQAGGMPFVGQMLSQSTLENFQEGGIRSQANADTNRANSESKKAVDNIIDLLTNLNAEIVRIKGAHTQ